MSALALLLLALATDAPAALPPSAYDALVASGLAQGREQRLEEAAATFARAIALDPIRPEAWVERGGVRFLDHRYDEAAADLREALARRSDDAYARDLLASSLFLAGRTGDALDEWNVLGGPRLHEVSITGLVETKDRVARRELAFAAGDLLGSDALELSKRQLEETQVFDRVTIRPRPLGDGRADLEVALAEQHGLVSSLPEALAGAAVNALNERVRLRYANVLGHGLTIGGSYRWTTHRPEASVFLQAPRPLGLPVYLRVQAFRGQQAYAVDGGFGSSRRGIDLSLRHVLDGRTVVQAGYRLRDRWFSEPRPDAPPGLVAGIEARLERRLAETTRDRLDLAASAFRAAPALGSDLTFSKMGLDLGYQRQLSAPEQARIEPSVLAARLRVGWGSNSVPVDEMFAPGGSPDMELPLRGHRQAPDGVLGSTSLGRSLVLTNVEWRRRIVSSGPAPLGLVVFYDGAWVGRDPEGGQSTFHDVGVGLRVALPGSGLLRVDYGHGLTDGSNAIFIGLNQVF
jgi:outer membrane protein assembly factor BamA